MQSQSENTTAARDHAKAVQAFARSAAVLDRQERLYATFREPEGVELLEDVLTDGQVEVTARFEETLRTIGALLIENGRADLWRLAYFSYCQEWHVAYVEGDEMRFLSCEALATPQYVVHGGEPTETKG